MQISLLVLRYGTLKKTALDLTVRQHSIPQSILNSGLHKVLVSLSVHAYIRAVAGNMHGYCTGDDSYQKG